MLKISYYIVKDMWQLSKQKVQICCMSHHAKFVNWNEQNIHRTQWNGHTSIFFHFLFLDKFGISEVKKLSI